MVDLNPIKQYIKELENSTIDFINNEVTTVGLDKFLEFNFTKLDCSRVNNEGMRLMQTIGYPYIHFVSETIYVIKNYIDKDNQDECLTKLLEIHNKNVEYEKINPPIWYGGEKTKRKFEKEYKVKAKHDKKPKEKSPSAAERKLAARVAKINALSFKIKPQN